MYTTLSGKSIKLGSKIAKGGEGEVFNIINDSDNCVKIYRENINIKDKEDKLKYMTLNPPLETEGPNHKICWPNDVVYKDDKFVGFLMSKSFDDSLLPYHLCQPEIPQKLDEKWHLTFDRESQRGIISRLKLCVNIIAAVNRIHSGNKYVIVDLKPQNLLITSSGKVSIIDMDSIQIIENDKVIFKAPVSTPEYTPPEATAIIKKKSVITKDWDVFSLGVLVYEILFGIHPFVGSAKPPNDNLNTIQEKIKINLTHIIKGEDAFISLPQPHKLFYNYPADFINILKKTFKPYTEGVSSRPGLDEFGGILFNTIKTLEEKGKKEEEERKLGQKKREELEQKEALKRYPGLKFDYSQLKSRHEDTLKLLDKQKQEKKLLEDKIKQKSGNASTAVIILLIALVGVSIAFFTTHVSDGEVIYESYREADRISLRNESLISENKDLISENKDLNYKYDKLIKSSQPIIINGITFSSELNGRSFRGFSTNLPSNKISYLYFRLNYYGNRSGNRKTYVKYYSPDGVLREVESSPKGYTFSTTDYFRRGTNTSERMTGWGNDTGWIWVKGTHRIEIWYNGFMLYKESFEII